MKKTLHNLLMLCMILSMCSCAEKIISSKAADYHLKPKRIFIVVTYPKGDKNSGKSLINEFHTQLQNRGVETAGYGHDNLSFDTDEDINKKITDFNADAVMTIKELFVNSGWTDNNFQISLVDAKTQQPFWKSTFTLSYVSASGEEVIGPVTSLIKKLEEDGVVTVYKAPAASTNE